MKANNNHYIIQTETIESLFKEDNLERYFPLFLNNCAYPDFHYHRSSKDLYNNLPLEIAWAQIPWAKKISQGESRECFDNSLFFNMSKNVDFFKAMVCQDDFAKVFGVTNRALKRVLYHDVLEIYQVESTRVNMYDFMKFSAVEFILKHDKDMDQQLLLPIEGMDHREASIMIKSLVSFSKSAIHLHNLPVSSAILVSGLFCGDDNLINDTESMISTVLSKNALLVDGQRLDPKTVVTELVKQDLSFKKLHDRLMFLSECEEGSTNLQPDQLYLQGKVIFGQDLNGVDRSYTIHVPMNSGELKRVGRFLNICVGNSSYEEKIKQGKSNILFLKENNKVVYCVEYVGKEMIQIKTKNNTSGNELKDLISEQVRGPSLWGNIKKVFNNRQKRREIVRLISVWAISAVGFSLLLSWLLP